MARAERDLLDFLNDDLDAFAAAATAWRDDAPRRRDPTEPDLARTFRRLRELDAEQEADPTLAPRIWEELMNETTLGTAAPVLLVDDANRRALNGRAAPRPWRTRLPERSPRREHRVSLLAQAATVLLLIAAMLAGYVAIRPQRQGVAPPLVGAPSVTPESVTDSDQGAREVLVQTTFVADRDASPIDLGFWRGAIAPGVRVSTPPDWAAHSGTEVELVLRGTLLVEADVPLLVVRAGSLRGEHETVPAGEELVLGAGDAAIIPTACACTYRNPGDETVELLGALAFAGDQRVIETLTPADGYLVRTGNLFGFVPAAEAPAGPLTLTFARLAGAENAWPAQAIREDGAVEWRMLEFLTDGTPQPGLPGGTVYVLTLESA